MIKPLQTLICIVLFYDCQVLSKKKCDGYYLKDHKNFNLLPHYPDCGRGHFQPGVESRIQNGELARLGELPWMVYLHSYRDDTYRPCGGSLINTRYVLSAAHCFAYPVDKPRLTRIKVVLGDYQQDNDIDCVKERCAPPVTINFATHIFLNAKFNRKKLFKDIGLLRLKDKVQYGDFIKPICLPFMCKLIEANHSGVRMTVAGWGKYENSSAISDHLRKIKNPVMDSAMCRPKVKFHRGPKIFNFQQCFAPERNKSSCPGDSGGPVMLEVRISSRCQCGEGRDEYLLGPTHYVNYLMAITSYLLAYCFKYEPVNDDIPEVHTRTVPFLRWILDTIEQ